MARVPIILLASALAPTSLAAQTVSPPVAWEDTPVVHLNVPGAAVMAGAVQAPMTMPPPAAPAMMTPAPVMARPMPPMAAHEMTIPPRAAAPMPGPGAFHGRHMTRGAQVGRFWWGPNVQLRNYGTYGLYPPAEGDRWIRYYDDALLVDGGGYVRDSRAGLDWDQYGEPWGAEDGIPVYVGNGDFRPDREDYAYVDQYRQAPPPGPMPMPRQEAMAPPPDAEAPPPHYFRRYVQARPSCYRQRTMVAPPPAYPAAAFDGDYPPGTVITETVTTTPPRVITRTYYIRETVVGRYAPRSKRVRRAPPPIPYGERG